MAVIFPFVISELTLTQLAKPETWLLDVADVLSLTDFSDSQYKIKTPTSELALIGELSPSTLVSFSTEGPLSVTHKVSKTGPIYVSAESLLNFTVSGKTSLSGGVTSNQLDLSGIVTVKRPIRLVALSELSVSDFELSGLLPEDQEQLKNTTKLRGNASFGGNYNVSAISYFSLAQESAKNEVGVASNHINIWQLAEVVLHEVVTSFLGINQVATVHNTQPATNVLDLTQTAVGNIEGLKSVTTSIDLLSVCSFAVVNFCDYSVGVGEGTFEYTPPSPIAPTLIRRPTTVFTWPYISPLLTVELRNPSFDNVEQFASKRINRRSLGGELDLYRDESWIKTRRLIMSFTSLSEVQRSDLLELLIKGLGQEVGILDFESRQWVGVILTPSSALSQPRREGYSVSLDFEGSLV